MSLRSKFDSFTVLAIIFSIVTVLVIIVNNSLQSSEDKLLQTLEINQKLVVHNQGVIINNDNAKNHNEQVIIHNQMQFAKYGMNNSVVNSKIRTDFQQTSTDFWTSPK